MQTIASRSEDVVRRFFDAYLHLRDLDKTLECLADDIRWIGTGDFERAGKGFCDCRELLIEEFKATPGSFDVKLRNLYSVEAGKACYTDGDMSVEEVATPGMMPSFQPLHPRTLPRSSGVTWLRLEIPAAGTERTESLMLDLGQGVPAGAVLYTPDIDPLSRQTTWQESQANWRNLLPLPLPAETPQVCFIRLDGQPPLWFAPTLRSLDNLAGAPESLLGPGVMLALAVVMLLALLRGITERGQWRFWTALYVGAALTHAVLGGPDLGAGNITPADAVSAMAPGLALMFLAHLARHLMQTASHSRLLDIQYLLLSLPGAVLALLPLWPDFSWLGRFLPLWPMLALIFVPTTLGAWLMGVPGARRFLLGCLVAALGAGLAVLDLGTLLPPFVQGTLPLWGTALSALIIAGMSAPGREAGTSAEPADPLAPGRPARNQTITDPNLRLLDTDGNTLPLMTGLSQPAPAPATVEAESASATAIRRLEQALAAPLREIVEQNRQLEQCALPHDVRSRVENMGRRARQALNLLHDPAGDAAAPAAPAPADTARAEKRVFDLRKTLRQAHDTCRPLAEKSGIALGWHVPADLEQLYEGPAGELEDVLRLLLEDALRATKGGKIHFAVRRVPDSKHPGHLLFQVRDTGTGLPPEQRSASLLARIWELSSSHGGFLGVESGPRGTSVIFTLQLHLPEASDGEDLPTVLVCAPDAATRHELGAMLRDLPCTCHETGTLAHGLATGARKGRTPAAVLLVCGPEASVDAAPLLRRYHSLAERTGPFGAVALTPDQSQWDALAHAGFSHALTLPVSEDALRETVLEILGSHDDVADLGAPLPETRQADAPLPDLFGPAAAPQADQGMPDLLLSTDDIPQQTAPAAPAAASADLPDLFAAPAAAAADTAQTEPLPLTDDMRLDTPAAQTARPVADAVQPEEAAPAESPVQENENAPDAAEDIAPAPAPAAPDFPSVPMAETAETSEAAMPEAPVKEEGPAAPAADMTREEPLPQQEAADAAAAAPADAATGATVDEKERTEAPVADAQASATRAPAFPSVEAVASPLAGGYVSPSLRHAGEWVGEPMPIGTPVNRPAPRQEETVSAPVETVVTVRPLRRDVSPDEIARKLGKPSLVPTDKSALITPQPRKSSSTGPAAGTQPAFPGAPVEETPQAVPGSKDVSSLPDMTPDSTTLLASGREETSRTRAAANTLMRFLSRFHTGNGQPQDKEEARSPQAPAATAQERQGTPRPMPRKDAPREETPGTTADIPATTNPWIERRTASRPVAPTPRMPVPPMPQRPQPPDDPEDPLPALMWRMDKYLAEAGYALEQRRLHLVADAAGRLAAEAESYGFRVLGRMARCVESAGRAKDLQGSCAALLQVSGLIVFFSSMLAVLRAAGLTALLPNRLAEALACGALELSSGILLLSGPGAEAATGPLAQRGESCQTKSSMPTRAISYFMQGVHMSYERVLLPVSGKHSGERALKALSQARKLDPKEIILLHAVAPSVGSPMPNIMRDQQDIAVKAEALLAPLAAELDNAGIPYQTVIRHGLPVETIVKAAKEMDAEAIVMFSDGRDDLTDRLFGSITEHVLRNTPLPVLVVRQ